MKNMKSGEYSNPHENKTENNLQNEAERLEIAKKAAIRKAAYEVLEGAGATS